jgi:hypothetical protein
MIASRSRSSAASAIVGYRCTASLDNVPSLDSVDSTLGFTWPSVKHS